MILGLDISTSIVGATIVAGDGDVISTSAWDMRNKNHFPDIFSKYNHVQGELLDLHSTYNIEHIYVEQSLQMFRSGFSSAKTLSTLSSFNGVVSYLCYREMSIKPEYIAAPSARKACGITISRGTKAKEQVVKFLLDNEPKFIVEYTKSGNIKPAYYDIADSIVIAKAGYQLVQQRKNINS
jgi:Holliday junction resolvasome RuvABC endonuclease subunit